MSAKAKIETLESQQQTSREIAALEQLDHELEGTFPASDPPSVTQPGFKPGAPERREGVRKASQARRN
jgi:hypothetical protein